jgi:hypothetical protein
LVLSGSTVLPVYSLYIDQVAQAFMLGGERRQARASLSFKKGDQKMNVNRKVAGMKDRKIVLSTLWIFAMFNYLYADVFTLFFNPAAQKETLAMPQEGILAFAIMMETAIAMVLLSRLLKYGANRWANVIAGIFLTALVVWSMTGSTQPLFMLMFESLEIACTLFITGYAWTWRNPEAQPVLQPAGAN